jgi:hypothetical protein
MKRLRILSIFMVLFTALGSMVSCETEPVDPLLLTDDNGGIDPTPDPGVFTVKIGSTLFVADSTVATLANGMIIVQGYKGTEGENVTITIPSTTTGTFTALMVYDPGTSTNVYNNIVPPPTTGFSGSVTISNINTVARTVSGNFNFTGYYSDPTQNLPSIAFTEGTFTNISYAGATTPPVNPTGPGSFKVDIDGQPFVADEADAYLGSLGFSIGGYKDNGEHVYIILDMEEPITPNTYTNASMTYSVEIHGNPGYNNSGDSGTMTITEIDTVNHTVSGTFSFTGDYSDPAAGRPEKVFTNGVFTDVPYGDEENFGDEFIAVVTPTGGNSMDNDYSSNLISGLVNNTINIQAIGEEDEIRLAIIDNVTQGTYVFTNAIGSQYKATFEVDNVDYPINGGSLTVISNENGRIKGSFNFEVKDETGAVIYTITSGNFDVKYDF